MESEYSNDSLNPYPKGPMAIYSCNHITVTHVTGERQKSRLLRTVRQRVHILWTMPEDLKHCHGYPVRVGSYRSQVQWGQWAHRFIWSSFPWSPNAYLQWTYMAIGRVLHGLFGQCSKTYRSGDGYKEPVKLEHPVKLKRNSKINLKPQEKWQRLCQP